MPRPFRFGVTGGSAQSRAEWVDRARKVEDLGYATLLVSDHPAMGMGPLAALGVAAAVTSTLRIGSFVFSNDFHHPALLAQEVATLDLLSEGRFELGMGAGIFPSDYVQTGFSFDPASTRIRRLDEAVRVIKQLYTADMVSFSGSFYTLANLRSPLKPLQKPYPPILIGGSGKRLLALAGREAQSVSVGFADARDEQLLVTPEAIEEKRTWIREAAGERFAQLELGFTVFQVRVEDGPNRNAHRITSMFETNVSEAASFPVASFHRLEGSLEQIVEELERRRELHDFSYVQVRASEIEAFAPVVARLAGK